MNLQPQQPDAANALLYETKSVNQLILEESKGVRKWILKMFLPKKYDDVPMQQLAILQKGRKVISVSMNLKEGK